MREDLATPSVDQKSEGARKRRACLSYPRLLAEAVEQVPGLRLSLALPLSPAPSWPFCGSG